VLGLSFSELLIIAVVALVAVGPQKLPGLLRTLGQWARKLRTMTTEMRAQSGIDDVLRAEGLHGGITELRSLMRGQASLLNQPLYVPPPPPAPPPPTTEAAPALPPAPEPEPVVEDPYADVEVDASREYPPEGPDAYGAIPDDLLEDPEPAPSPYDAEATDTEALAEASQAAEPPAEATAEAASPTEPEAAPTAPISSEKKAS
jgi:sec-independent protein translocase protein TatB